MRYEPVSVEQILAALARPEHKHLWTNGRMPELEEIGLLLTAENIRHTCETIEGLGFRVVREVQAQSFPGSGWHSWVKVVGDGEDAGEFYGPYRDIDTAGSKGYTYANALGRSNPRTEQVTYQVYQGEEPVGPPRQARQRWTKAWPEKPRRTCQFCENTIVQSGGAWLIVESGPQLDGVVLCPTRPADERGNSRLHRPLRGPARAEEG